MIKSFRFKFLTTLIISILIAAISMPLISIAAPSNMSPYMDPNQFEGYEGATQVNVTEDMTTGDLIFKIGGYVLNIVRIIALSWGILMLISIAIKYMTGSAQIKAQLKTDIPTYLIGAVILFGSAGLLTLIKFFMEDTVGAE